MIIMRTTAHHQTLHQDLITWQTEQKTKKAVDSPLQTKTTKPVQHKFSRFLEVASWNPKLSGKFGHTNGDCNNISANLRDHSSIFLSVHVRRHQLLRSQGVSGLKTVGSGTWSFLQQCIEKQCRQKSVQTRRSTPGKIENTSLT